MNKDPWIASGLCTVSVVYIEQLRVRLKRAMHRRLELDAWEMEGQVLRDARLGRWQPLVAAVRARMTWRHHAPERRP